MTEKAASMAAQVGPVANEVAIVAADSSMPVAAIQHLIDYVHCYTGFNWWASIVVTTILIRSIQLPLMIHVSKSFSKLGGLLVPVPIFCSFLLAVSNMAENVPSFKEGGAFWFTDLTTPDSTFIFPILIALLFLIPVECNRLKATAGTSKIVFRLRILVALTIPLTAMLNKAIFCYWITNCLYGFAFRLVLTRPGVKEFLGFPIIPTSSKPANEKKSTPSKDDELGERGDNESI